MISDWEQQRLNAIHSVDGRVMPCCEEGETDCPCVCHESPQRCGCGNLAHLRADGGCSCHCHLENQRRERTRVLSMLNRKETSHG